MGHEGRVVRMSGVAAVLGAAMALQALPADAQAPTGAVRPNVFGFILRTVYAPVPNEAGACPVESAGALELFERSLTPADKAAYGGPENREKLIKLMAERLHFRSVKLDKRIPAPEASDSVTAALRQRLGFAPGKGALVSLGSRFAYDTCTDPEDFPQFDKGNQTYLGRTSVGADLDGRTDRLDFVAPDGRRGIDNNLLRAVGCNLGNKDYGDPKRAETALISQTAPTVVEIADADDLENDPDVTVRIYAAAQSLDVAADGDALAWASVDIDPDPRFAAEVKGRIEKGVLTTAPFAFSMRQKESVVETYRSFVGARLRLERSADGGIRGELYGYQTLRSLDDQYRAFSQNAADFSRTSCPAIRTALHRLADGVRDPKTGRFTAISAAYRLNGVPAFLIHPAGHGGAAPRAVAARD